MILIGKKCHQLMIKNFSVIKCKASVAKIMNSPFLMDLPIFGGRGETKIGSRLRLWLNFRL